MAKPKLEVGKVYKVVHERKGTFSMRITKFNHTWVSGIIAKGKTSAPAAHPEGVHGVGEEVTERVMLCTFTEVPETK